MSPEIIESIEFTASQQNKNSNLSAATAAAAYSNVVVRSGSRTPTNNNAMTINKDQKHEASIMLEELAIKINQRNKDGKKIMKANQTENTY